MHHIGNYITSYIIDCYTYWQINFRKPYGLLNLGIITWHSDLWPESTLDGWVEGWFKWSMHRQIKNNNSRLLCIRIWLHLQILMQTELWRFVSHPVIKIEGDRVPQGANIIGKSVWQYEQSSRIFWRNKWKENGMWLRAHVQQHVLWVTIGFSPTGTLI